MSESLRFWITLVMGFVLCFFAMIWVLGFYILLGNPIIFLIKKYFKVRNWLHLKKLQFELFFLRWWRRNIIDEFPFPPECFDCHYVNCTDCLYRKEDQ